MPVRQRRNPPAVPADTSLEVWHVQMAAAASRSVDDRLREWAAMCRANADMQADHIRRRNPNYDERQVFLALVRARYGDDLYQAAWPGEPLLEA
jgi:hypothetical protein